MSKIRISPKAVLVDALIGTGLKGELRNNIKKSILSINKLGDSYPVMSLDIPSGVCSDSGLAKEPSVIADITCTFGEERVFYLYIFYSDLDIPKRIFSKVSCTSHIINMEDHLHKIILRDENSHKGAFGHTFVVGGNKGFGGAAILAAKAAAFSGAGLIGLGTRPEHLEASLLSCPEVMTVGVDSGQDLEEHLTKPNVIAIGPGLDRRSGQNKCSKESSGKQIKEITVVMDADALNLLTKLKLSAKLPKNFIMTPHPGEASRLLNKSIDEIESNRFKAVSLLQEKYNCVAVLKGSGSLVCYKKGGKQKIGICEAGNPGMASGGMGDILTGIIAGFLAQGLSLLKQLN